MRVGSRTIESGAPQREEDGMSVEPGHYLTEARNKLFEALKDLERETSQFPNPRVETARKRMRDAYDELGAAWNAMKR